MSYGHEQVKFAHKAVDLKKLVRIRTQTRFAGTKGNGRNHYRVINGEVCR